MTRRPQPCPHCGRNAAVEIVYGYPTDDAIEDARRGGIALGGCSVSSQDPTFVCRSCGSEWASSNDLSESRISGVFADCFSNWHITLPPGAEAVMARGSIRKAGWVIRYRFDEDDGKVLEFYATHRMTDDRRLRIHESGRIESRPTIESVVLLGKEEEHREHNRAVADELRLLGLYPEDDINTYLRTHDVPPSTR